MRFSPKGDRFQKRYRKQTENTKKDSNTVSWWIDKIFWLREGWESLRKIRGFRGQIAENFLSVREKNKINPTPPKKQSREDFK